MNRNWTFSFLICVLAVSGCAIKELRVSEYRVAPETPNPAKPPEEFYVIGAGDSIGINVWKEPSLSGSVKVRPDGYITMPLINEVQVVGLTTAQLRKLLEEKYKEFTTDPFVTIRIEGISSSEVFLVGEVGRTGRRGAQKSWVTQAPVINAFRAGRLRRPSVSPPPHF